MQFLTRLYYKTSYYRSVLTASQPIPIYLLDVSCCAGACLGPNMAHALTRPDIEHVEILIDNVASYRMAELAANGQP